MAAMLPGQVMRITPEVRGVQMRDGSGITDVAGITVGHHTSTGRPTGCTVVLCEEGAVAGVDVRGAAPGSRETDLLDPINLVDRVQAVLLAGGSAFGLDAASGVVRYLEEKGRGFMTPAGRVPIVPAAVLYDLTLGDSKIRPDATSGYEACRQAASGTTAIGNVGAGAGATVGKLFGQGRAMRGGIGTAAMRLGNGLTVGAIIAVNAVGDVVDPDTGRVIAGVRTPDGKRLLGSMAAIRQGEPLPALLGGSATTIGVVAVDAKLDKVGARRVAMMAHDGLARVINPVHTQYDGDTIFTLATGRLAGNASPTLIGALAAEVVARAVIIAVRSATGRAGLPAAGEIDSVPR
ncbi:MAG: peptidase S58 family protein [Acidobacteria bacterium]|nr:peptidase S58 family protein [Acidobacteriota bacterium]